MEKLTLELAKEKVQHIENIKHDDEAAHSSEDSLYEWFINCVANGLYDSIYEMRIVANEIVKTGNIDFARWCA